MVGRPPPWFTEVKPLPGKWIARVLLIAVTAALIAVDISAGELDLATPIGWVFLVVPCLPLLALLVGAVPAAVTLLLSIVGLLAALATVGTEYQIAQMTFPTAITLGLCAMMLPLRVALVFAPASIVLMSLSMVVHPTELTISTVLVVLLIMIVAAGAGLGLGVYGRRNDRSAAQIRSLREQQARIRADERMTLAYELHDIVAHDVTIIAMQARRAQLVQDPSKTAQIIEGIGDSAQQALNDLRSLVLLLKSDAAPSAPADETDLLGSPELSGETTSAVGLAHDLEGVADALQRAGFDVVFTLEGELARVPASLRQALRRTIRELGTNVLKHADPSQPVEMTMTVGSDAVIVSTVDAPASTSPLSSTTTGLEAMRARSEVFGGSVTSGMSEGKWRTIMTLPLERALQPMRVTEETP